MSGARQYNLDTGEPIFKATRDMFSIWYYFDPFSRECIQSEQSHDNPQLEFSPNEIIEIMSQITNRDRNISPLLENLVKWRPKTAQDDPHITTARARAFVCDQIFEEVKTFYIHEQCELKKIQPDEFPWTPPKYKYMDQKCQILLDDFVYDNDSKPFVASTGNHVYVSYCNSSRPKEYIVVQFELLMFTNPMEHSKKVIHTFKKKIGAMWAEDGWLYVESDNSLWKYNTFNGKIGSAGSSKVSGPRWSNGYGYMYLKDQTVKNSETKQVTPLRKFSGITPSKCLFETNGELLLILPPPSSKNGSYEYCYTMCAQGEGGMSVTKEMTWKCYILAITFDCVNQCHWAIVTPFGNPRENVRLVRIRAKSPMDRRFFPVGLRNCSELDVIERMNYYNDEVTSYLFHMLILRSYLFHAMERNHKLADLRECMDNPWFRTRALVGMTAKAICAAVKPQMLSDGAGHEWVTCLRDLIRDDNFDGKLVLFLNDCFPFVSTQSQDMEVASFGLDVLPKLFSQILALTKVGEGSIFESKSPGYVMQAIPIAFARAVTTAAQGGLITQFQRDFAWLLNDNLDYTEQSMDISPREVPGVSEAMEVIYKKWKQWLNRNLSTELKELDAISFLASLKHLCRLQTAQECYDEVRSITTHPEKINEKISEFLDALDVMMSIRSRVRCALQQNDKSLYEPTMARCKLLFTLHPSSMDFDTSTRKDQIVQFLKRDETAKEFGALFGSYIQRRQFIEKGLNFTSFSNFSHPVMSVMYKSVISCLAEVPQFEVINVICRHPEIGMMDDVIEKIQQFMAKHKLVDVKDSYLKWCLGLVYFRLMNACESAQIDGVVFEQLIGSVKAEEEKGDEFLFFALCCQAAGRSPSDAEAIEKAFGTDLASYTIRQWIILLIFINRRKCDIPFLSRSLLSDIERVNPVFGDLMDRAFAGQIYIADDVVGKYKHHYYEMLLSIGTDAYRISAKLKEKREVRILQSILRLPDCSNRRTLIEQMAEVNVSSPNELIQGFLAIFIQPHVDNYDVRVGGKPALSVKVNKRRVVLTEKYEKMNIEEERPKKVGEEMSMLDPSILKLFQELVVYAIQFPGYLSSAWTLAALSHVCLSSFHFAMLCRRQISTQLLRSAITAFQYRFSSENVLEKCSQNKMKEGSGWEMISFNEHTLFLSARMMLSGRGSFVIDNQDPNITSCCFYVLVESAHSHSFDIVYEHRIELSEATTDVNLSISRGVMTAFIGESVLFDSVVLPDSPYNHVGIFIDSSDQFDVSSDSDLFVEKWELRSVEHRGVFGLPMTRNLCSVSRVDIEHVNQQFRNGKRSAFGWKPSIGIVQFPDVKTRQSLFDYTKTTISAIGSEFHNVVLETVSREVSMGYLSIAILKLIDSGRYQLKELDISTRLFVALLGYSEANTLDANGSSSLSAFPYDLDKCPWEHREILRKGRHILSRSVVQNVFKRIICIPGFADYLCSYLKAAFRRPESHFPKNRTVSSDDPPLMKCTFIPKFGCQNNSATFYSRDSNCDLGDSPHVLWEIRGRNWALDTPYEFLLVLKNFAHLARTSEHMTFLHLVFVDSFLLNSPFICLYTNEFFRFFWKLGIGPQTWVTPDYYAKLRAIWAKQLPLPKFTGLTLQAEKQLTEKYFTIVGQFEQFLPEFSNNSNPIPGLCEKSSLSLLQLGPGVSSPLADAEEIRLLLSHYDTLEGFPWWIYFRYWMRAEAVGKSPFSILEIRDRFVNDCRLWIFDWKQEHTNRLLSYLQGANKKISRSSWECIDLRDCPLLESFPETVVRVRFMALDTINNICSSYNSTDSAQIGLDVLLPKMVDFLLLDNFMTLVTEMMESFTLPVRPRIVVDRRRARFNEDTNVINSKESIIGQVVALTRDWTPQAFQNKPFPWCVGFVGENAFDAGGPTKEIMEDIASSMFHKTSNLMIPAPSAQDLFIPFSQEDLSDQYLFIGRYLGIVMRARLCHDMPFPTLVWKYLVGEPIAEEDVTSLDSELGSTFGAVRQWMSNPTDAQYEWKTTDWQGCSVQLPGHSEGQTVNEWEGERYIRECVDYRVSLLARFLDPMRKGFRENVGTDFLQFANQNLVRRMCQGEVTIDVEKLKRATEYSDYHSTETPIVLFWQVVEKMTNDQRSRLLRFATALSRFPRTPNFKFIIQKRTTDNPDKEYLRASTCFNRIYLPCYTNFEAAWERIIFSIENCATMENQ